MIFCIICFSNLQKNKTMKTFLAIQLAFFSIFSFAQSPADTVWTKIIGGSLDEAPGYGTEMRSNIDINEDGDIFVFFNTLSNDNYISSNYGDRDLYLAKLNSTGDTVWTRVIGGSDWDMALDVLATDDGGCYIAGYTYSQDYDMESHNDSGEGCNAFVAKYSGEGEKIWLETYGGSEFFGVTSMDKVNSISVLSNGNILAVGQTNSQNDDLLNEINMDAFYVGLVIEINSTDGDIVDIKKIWWTNHDEYNSDIIYDGFELPDNDGFIFFGESIYSPFDVDKLWMVKTDANYDVEWQKEFGSASYNIGYKAVMKNNEITIAAAIQAADGDFIGETFGNSDIWVGTLNTDGNIIKQNIIGGSEGEMVFDMISTYQGFILAGFTNSTDYYGSGDPSTVSDFWLLNLDNNLDTINTPYKNGGTDSDALTGVAYSNGKLVVTGRTSSNDSLLYQNFGGRDIWIAELSDLVSENQKTITYPDINIYPNPNNGIFTIKSSEQNNLEIYNINGQLIYKTLLQPNTHKTIDISNLSSGMYFVKAIGKNTINTQKVIIE